MQLVLSLNIIALYMHCLFHLVKAASVCLTHWNIMCLITVLVISETPTLWCSQWSCSLTHILSYHELKSSLRHRCMLGFNVALSSVGKALQIVWGFIVSQVIRNHKRTESSFWRKRNLFLLNQWWWWCSSSSRSSSSSIISSSSSRRGVHTVKCMQVQCKHHLTLYFI